MPEAQPDEETKHTERPLLADPEAPGKVGEGLRERFSESLDKTGRAIAAITGLGVFFFATGYFVEWQRLKRGHLPSEEILPLIPKDQIAAAGVRELAISFVFGAVTLLVLGVGLVYVARKTQDREGRLATVLNHLFSRELAFPTAIVGVLALLIVPFTFAGVTVAVILTLLLYIGLRLIHGYLADGEKFPLWQLCLATAIAAIALTGARQREFPQPRPWATITVKGNHEPMRGSYIASDSDKVLIRVRTDHGAQVIVLDPDELDGVRFQEGRQVLPETPSLFDDVAGLFALDIHLACIPPECSTGNDSQFGPSLLF